MKKNLLNEAKKEEKNVVRFLRDLIAIPGESCGEAKVIERIRKEMLKTGFDSVSVDKMGNILGKVGHGKHIIAMDAHIDTVGVGDIKQWKWDPYKGKLEKGVIYGRGAVDQLAGMAGMVYGVKLLKKLNLMDDFTLYVVGSVQEEDCDGLCWQYIIKESKLKPECVIITEPTNLDIYIGQRGRMEIGVTTKGKAAHGSMPDRGINAIYKMSGVIKEIEKLNERLKKNAFLGKGTVVVSYVDCKTPSMCAVPDECYIQLDRRLTTGETKELALREVREAVKKAGVKADVKLLKYDKPSWKGLKYPTDTYFPTWILPKNHKLLEAAEKTYLGALGKKAKVSRWIFSTNGVATMGMFKIPTLGFGPGNEKYAHSVNDQVPVEHLVKAAAWYALFPKTYCNSKGRNKK
ncbi:YgeY family selenium metabolism-linked hydrolase [bacterium]|nr:YgeY family selenium metabolism-linked hydrolase [bacterium]